MAPYGRIFLLGLAATVFTLQAAHAQRLPTPGPQEVLAPYWSSEPGWETELELKNNLLATRLIVTPVLRLASGSEIALTPVTIPASASVSIAVNDELLKLSSSALNQPGSFGSVIFRFTSFHGRNLFAALTLRLHGQPISFRMNAYPTIESEMPSRRARPGSWEGVWWQHHAGVHDTLVFANSISQNVSGTLWLSDASGKRWHTPLTVGGHQTQRLDVTDLLHQAGLSGSYGGLRFDVPAYAPALSSVHLISDEASGFGVSLKMFAHDPSTTVKERMGPNALQWTTYAPMLALHSPDPATGFPSGLSLQPMVLVRNTTSRSIAANITLSWRGDSGKGIAALPQVTLAPYETRQIIVGAMQKRLNIPDDAHWALVTLTASAAPDEVIASAISYDATGRYGSESAFSDNLGGYFAGGEWKADSTHNGLISITNGGAKPADALLTLHYAANLKYELEQTISPGEQMWINVADLIRNRVADRKGRTLPAELTLGTYDVQALTTDHGTLLPASQNSDNVWGGTLRGGQVDCCGDYGSSFEPGSFNLVENQPNPFEVLGTNQCTGAKDNLTNLFSFSVANPAIASISKHTLTGLSPGLTNADGVGWVYYCQGDIGGFQQVEPVAPITVTPVITAVNQIYGAAGFVPMRGSVPDGDNYISFTASCNPSSGTFTWSTKSTNVTLENTDSPTAVVNSAKPSATLNDTTIQVVCTAGGETSAPYTVNLTVQQPTKLVKTGTDTTTKEATCTVNGATGCGVNKPGRTFNYQVYDQLNPANPIQASMDIFDGIVTVSGSDGCGLGTNYQTTCPGNSSCNKETATDGSFPEMLSICSTACISKGSCIGQCAKGPTKANQTWTINGVAVTGDVKALAYNCSSVLVNGQ